MFDINDIVGAAKRIIQEMPHVENPRTPDGTCLYTSAADPDHHCFGGQILIELGLPCPGPEVVCPFSLLPSITGLLDPDTFTDRAWNLANRLQLEADSRVGGTWGGRSRAWGRIFSGSFAGIDVDHLADYYSKDGS